VSDALGWHLERLHDDAGTLPVMRSNKAARDKVDEIGIVAIPISTRDEDREHYANMCDGTSLRKLILQKHGDRAAGLSPFLAEFYARSSQTG
jgi:hypothetical protein